MTTIQWSQCHSKLRRHSIFDAAVLLLLSCLTLALTHSESQSQPRQIYSVEGLQPLGKSCGVGVCSDLLTLHSRHLQSQVADSQRRNGPTAEVRLLAADGSISEAYLIKMDPAVEESMRLPWPVIGPLPIVPNATLVISVEDKKGFAPCKESMRDFIPWGLKVKGTEACVVMVPPHYVRQYKWPHSQFKARLQNVPNVPLLKSRVARDWVHVNSSTIFFLPGGPMYPKGADAHLDLLVQLVPDLRLGETTRMVLDVGGGTGSLSWALAKRRVATLCVTPYESPENAVQLLMERGYPGLLTRSFTSRTRLPFPSQAFDLLHCADCNIAWLIHDGALLFEADRILRRGGFFVWKMDAVSHRTTWPDMELQTGKMCWKLLTREGQMSVWRKPINITATDCTHERHVPLCSTVSGSHATWKVAMKICLEGTSGDTDLMRQTNWTSSLIHPPDRLWTVSTAGIQEAKQEAFTADLNYWVYLTDFYVRFFGSSRVGEVHNVIDANAGYGGFAAALALRTPPVPWWVLNVVPVDGPDRLPVIFDRGLLGLHHDWCEAFDAYPRTFDLIHVSGYFSNKHGCSMRVILQEMDRLLRPGGFALFRDNKHAITNLKRIAEALHWKTHVEDTESGPVGTDKLLHCQKTKWPKRPRL